MQKRNRMLYLLRQGRPVPIRGVMSDTTSRIIVHECTIVILEETFSPGSTDIMNTKTDAAVIRTLKKYIVYHPKKYCK